MSDLREFLKAHKKETDHKNALAGVGYKSCKTCGGKGTVGEGWTDVGYGLDIEYPAPNCNVCRGHGKVQVPAKKSARARGYFARDQVLAEGSCRAGQGERQMTNGMLK